MGQERRVAKESAGAFMGPDIMVPIPMRPLGIDPEPKEPASEDDPTSSPVRQSTARRLVRRLTGRGDPGAR